MTGGNAMSVQERVGAMAMQMLDGSARKITSRLYTFIYRDEMDVPMALEMYDWVRESSIRDEDAMNLPVLARRWKEHERTRVGGDWLMRAFGD